jgi:acyl-CoA synthetase (AMP-forming)/AMP-acid ligase II
VLTLSDIPRKWARLAPEREALVFDDDRLSWRTLDSRVDRLAHAFRSLGIKRGEHIAVLAMNHHRYVELYYAASRAGNVIVPLNWRLAGEELKHILVDAEAVALFVDPEFGPVVDKIRDSAHRLRVVVSFGDSIEVAEGYEALLAAAPSVAFPDTRDENALFILMYTGGTTGKPKGVMLSNRNLMAGTLGCLLGGPALRPTDTTLLVLPLFHIALWPVVAAHFAGARAVISRRFDLAEVLEILEREQVTHVNLVPTVVGFLLAFPGLDEHDLSSLRLITYAGSPMPLDLLLRLRARLPEVDIVQGYGMTEAAPIISVLDEVAHRDTTSVVGLRHLEGAGHEALTTEVQIVDEGDQPAAPGVVGEIVARGANVMLGYWKNPELTAVRLRGGWLHTGDLGTLDEDGFLYIVGRADDMIITGGENVHPREVEEVIVTHPAVAQCAVVGLPDPAWGEQVTAFVVCRAGQSATAEDIVSLCEERLAGYKRPRRVEFRDSLPMTLVGKVSHRQIREAETQMSTSNRGPSSTAT